MTARSGATKFRGPDGRCSSGAVESYARVSGERLVTIREGPGIVKGAKASGSEISEGPFGGA